ncbi:hypothetical protein GRF63_06545 [Erythrobacter sp. GH3-10]|uniref:Alpha/beta hydrolase domain-containing protein n=1 Tax=Aurantiacibacter rhizosphaerae TaxID=2691582 RepID=A0A844XCK1_9SPHN|nr:hypothetical protein [Aurantiacibacter rhizosphaerae]
MYFSAPAMAEVPPMPHVVPVPPSGIAPLSSASREGTEYIDLEAAGYEEEEYYLSGIAPAITAEGETLFDAPYTTRILVRRPKDPDRFNGTVIIEPFTWFGERGASWILTREYLLRQGYAYVGYTLNINKPEQDPKFLPTDLPKDIARYVGIVNFEFMRDFDYSRYSPLGFYFDPDRFKRGEFVDPFVPQSQGVGAQLAYLLKSNDPDGPLAGLQVDRVYVNSWAVTAQVWMDYLDQGRHQQWRMPDGSALIDAYMTGRMSFGEVGGEVIRVPEHMPEDAPFVTIFTQSELRYNAVNAIPLPADTDSPKLRHYEIPGTPHLRPEDVGTGEIEPMPVDVGKEDDPRCNTLYNEPVEIVASALLDGMDKWVRDGTPMPKSPRVERSEDDIVRDATTGNAIGGVRLPWVAAPSAVYLVEEETNCGLAYDTKTPYSAQRLREMYGSYANYRAQYEAAKAEAVAQGYILPHDAAFLQTIATPEDFTGEGD